MSSQQRVTAAAAAKPRRPKNNGPRRQPRLAEMDKDTSEPTYGTEENGFMVVNVDGEKYFVHDLVASAFLGPCPVGFKVRHKDGNGFNNKLENLEYVRQ
jgi:hypothetical protein